MCRSIKRLHNLAPPADESEIRDAAVQFIRKIYGSTKPAKANEAAFDAAVDSVANATSLFLQSVLPTSQPATREQIKERQRQRFQRANRS